MNIDLAAPGNYKIHNLIRLYFDELDHGIIITDYDLNIMYLNEKSLILLNLDTGKRYTGEKINEAVTFAPFLNSEDDFMNVFETGIPKIFENVSVKNCLNNKYLKIVITKVEDYLIIKIYNKTSDKRLEYELEHTREQLKSTIKCLNAVKKEERRIIGQAIHDDMGQNLTALKYQAFNLTAKLKKNFCPYAGMADEINSSIDCMTASLKGITSRLIPFMYDNESLADRVYFKVNEFRKISNININFCVAIKPDNLDIRSEDSGDLLKILQEALTNAVRHSNATKVRVTLEKTDDNIELTIKDNGRGISENEINSADSFGLRGMYMRCDKKDRMLIIRGEAGNGTTVKAVFYFSNKLNSFKEAVCNNYIND